MLVVSATAGVVGMTQGELCRGEKLNFYFDIYFLEHLGFSVSPLPGGGYHQGEHDAGGAAQEDL